jgi:hypothetical protein
MGGTIFAELDLTTLQGGQGLGFYRLIAQVDITTHSKQVGEEVVITNIHGELWVRGKEGPEYFLGNIGRQGANLPLTTYQHTNKEYLPLEIELDSRRIDSLERIRCGGDLFFRLNLYGVGTAGRQNRPQPANTILQYRANQSTWIEILEQMNYRKVILLEIPMPEKEDLAQFQQAADSLRTAQTHMLRGHFKDAVGTCRDVLELVSSALNDEKEQAPESIKSLFEGTREMDKEQRLRVVRRSLKILTHPARHADQVSTSVEWGPLDASSVIMMTAALLQLAAEKRSKD